MGSTITVHGLSQLGPALNDAINHGLEAAAEHWKDEMLPKHFEQSAYSEYGYMQRSVEWEEIKGHSVPLIGEREGKNVNVPTLEESVFDGTFVESEPIAGAKPWARVVIPVPDPQFQRAETPDELTRITESEVSKLADIAGAAVEQYMNGIATA